MSLAQQPASAPAMGPLSNFERATAPPSTHGSHPAAHIQPNYDHHVPPGPTPQLPAPIMPLHHTPIPYDPEAPPGSDEEFRKWCICPRIPNYGPGETHPAVYPDPECVLHGDEAYARYCAERAAQREWERAAVAASRWPKWRSEDGLRRMEMMQGMGGGKGKGDDPFGDEEEVEGCVLELRETLDKVWLDRKWMVEYQRVFNRLLRRAYEAGYELAWGIEGMTQGYLSYSSLNVLYGRWNRAYKVLLPKAVQLDIPTNYLGDSYNQIKKVFQDLLFSDKNISNSNSLVESAQVSIRRFTHKVVSTHMELTLATDDPILPPLPALAYAMPFAMTPASTPPKRLTKAASLMSFPGFKPGTSLGGKASREKLQVEKGVERLKRGSMPLFASPWFRNPLDIPRPPRPSHTATEASTPIVSESSDDYPAPVKSYSLDRSRCIPPGMRVSEPASEVTAVGEETPLVVRPTQPVKKEKKEVPVKKMKSAMGALGKAFERSTVKVHRRLFS
ncbi:hypothetical protein IAT38_002571 [Cryptococcus sp. DSM 104549]